VPSEGVVPSPLGVSISAPVVSIAGVVVPERLVPVRVRAVVLRDAERRVVLLPPVRRVVPLVRAVVARAAVRPVVLRRAAGLRRRAAGLRVVLRRAAGLRAVLRPPRAPSVFAAAFTRVDVLSRAAG
jgi:hypothetical protein